jgi:hypothetical protein
MPAYDKRQLLKSAYNYAQSGSWDRALEEYRRVTKLFPDDPNVHSMVADILVKKNDPAAAAVSHLEAARLHKDQGADDKELSSLRKALKVQSGQAEARQRLDSYFTRQTARASQLMASARLKEAEELVQKLLDADPGHLQVNRLLDEIRAKQMQEEAVLGLLEEERLAASVAPALDTTREVMERLRSTADAYLKSEDFDNAIDTLLIMLKIEPSKTEIRSQLEEAQERLKKKQQAQAVWNTILTKDEDRLSEVKERESTAKEMADWATQEQAVRERLAGELAVAENEARQELEVIERAVEEIRSRVPAAPAAGAEPSAMQKSIAAADESRLRALEMEKRQLEERLQKERDEAVERERLIQEQVRRESEMLRHAIELEKGEMEAKAKEAALKELEAKLAEERAMQAKLLEEERGRSQAAEGALRSQLQDLMKEEMAKLRVELQAQNHDEVQARLRVEDERRMLEAKLEEERRGREARELELRLREEQALRRYQDEQKEVAEAKHSAEEKARAEREAIESLKSKEEGRKQAFLDEALKRRGMRSGVSGSEDKQKVMQASRRISDVLHAATTKHIEQDVEAMLETARRYLAQDLLLDAMRLCQKIAATDPQNDKVKTLLKEIYVRKGL